MKHDLPSLEALKVFESSAKKLSFSAAAEELCITKAAVSYQIKKLESAINCALFNRSVRQIYLTDAGQALLRATDRSFADLRSTLEQLRPSTKKAVHVGATTYVAMRWLSPRIAAFNEERPDINVVYRHSVNDAAFKLQDVDFAVHWGEMTPHAKSAMQFAMPLFPVCSPAALKRLGLDVGAGLKRVNFSQAPCAQLPLLCEDRPLDLWSSWFGRDLPASIHARKIIKDANVRTQAAADGLGWTLADAMMQREIDSGQLIAPFSETLEGYGYEIKTAHGRFLSEDAQALREFLCTDLDH